MSNKNMSILHFINLTNEKRISAVEIAKKHLNLLNVKNKINPLLRECGFQYNQREKQWRKVIEKGITENTTFEEFVELNNLSEQYKFKGQIAPARTVSNKKEDAERNTNVFTEDEVKKLKEIIKLYENGLSVGADSSNLEHLSVPITNMSSDIRIAIQSLGRAAVNIKRTYVIDEQLARNFTKFCDDKKIKYSDALSVAIKNLLESYK